MSDEPSVPESEMAAASTQPAGAGEPPDAFDRWVGWVERHRVLGWPLRAIRRLIRRPYFLGVCLFFVVSASTVLAQLDKLLRAMHNPGEPAYGVASLSHVLGSTPTANDVYQTWQNWFTQARQGSPKPPDPTWVLSWYLGIDAVFFVVFYSLLFALLLDRARRRFDHDRANAPTENDPIYIRWIAVAFIAVPVLGLVDWGENLFQGLLGSGIAAGNWQILARVLTGCKWALVVLVVGVLVFAWAGIGWRYHRHRLTSTARHPNWLRELRLSRVPVFLVVVLGFLLLGPGPLSEQSLDVMRRMSDRFTLIWIPILLAVLLSAVLGVVCRTTLPQRQAGQVYKTRERPTDSKTFSWIVLGLGAGTFLLLILLDLVADLPIPVGLLVPPAIAGVVALLSLLAIGAAAPIPRRLESAGAISRLVVAAPLVLFGLTAVEAATGDVFYSGGARPLLLLVAIGVPCMLAGGVAYLILDRIDHGGRSVAWAAWAGYVVLAIGLALACVFLIGSILSPWWTSSTFDGAISVALGALLTASFVGLLLTAIGERVRVPAVFALLRFKRVPVLTLLLIWFVVASTVDTVGSNAVRLLPVTAADSPKPVALTDAFHTWVGEKQPRLERGTGARQVRPMLFVTAAGGGIRAAYWTALVLNCLVDDPQSCHGKTKVDPGSIFAVSGASGGSLGLVEYAAQQEHPTEVGKNWVNQTLGGDFLGPTFAWMFFVDAPNALLRARLWDDRAAILERSWEQPWGSGGALQEGLFQRGDRFPILLLNGTSVKDGCRFETSVLSGGVGRNQATADCLSPTPFEQEPPPPGRDGWIWGATKDFADYLCQGQDVRLSTAALLSARFPYVTPSGKIGCAKPGHPDPSYVVDGGYYDNTGASTVTELWTQLEPMVAQQNLAHPNAPCIVPFLVEIDNHYTEPPAPGNTSRPKELTVPPTTLATVRNGHDSNAQQVAALQFGDGKAAFVYPRSHPGTEAPLGWTLSDTSQADLESQLANSKVQDELRQILDLLLAEEVVLQGRPRRMTKNYARATSWCRARRPARPSALRRRGGRARRR